MIRRRLLIVFLGAASGLVYAAERSGPNPEVTTVRIENFAFVPATLVVRPGTTVRWINADAVDHDVTSGTSVTGRRARGLSKTRLPDGHFSSGLFGPGRDFAATLDAVGSYPYYCNVHPFMTGRVIVRE